MKLEWTDGEDYGLDEAGFYEGTPPPAPPPRKHVSFSLRLDLVSLYILTTGYTDYGIFLYTYTVLHTN